MNEVVIESIRETRIPLAGRDLTVETVILEQGDYSTRVVDTSGDKRHSGMKVGGWVIDVMHVPAANREAAMSSHREAVRAATYEQIEPRRTS